MQISQVCVCVCVPVKWPQIGHRSHPWRASHTGKGSFHVSSDKLQRHYCQFVYTPPDNRPSSLFSRACARDDDIRRRNGILLSVPRTIDSVDSRRSLFDLSGFDLLELLDIVGDSRIHGKFKGIWNNLWNGSIRMVCITCVWEIYEIYDPFRLQIEICKRVNRVRTISNGQIK